jgi:hypothetical protein
MKHLTPLLLVVLAACGSGASSSSTTSPRDRDWALEERQKARTAGHCDRCNLDVYDGHRCTLTVPCPLCQREHGARHYHEVAWKCERDGVVAREIHICNDAKTCETCLHATNAHAKCSLCREGRHTDYLTRTCDYCFRTIPIVAVQGITVYCGACNLESGANHIHGKTVFCAACVRESGQGHVHDVTRLCATHERDCAVDHVHGRTEYCQACRRDAGPNHRHGETIWCYRCDTEAPWPHCHHTD